jgi:hypothetical protein
MRRRVDRGIAPTQYSGLPRPFGTIPRKNLEAYMVKLKADFESDWIAHLRTILMQVHGWNVNEVNRLDAGDVPMYYFDSFHRRIAPRPRVIKMADNFHCEPSEEAGWNALRDKVKRGDDLNSHLSKGHASLHNNDGLLAEWGVHHFHLGIGPDPKNPSFTKRSGPLAYALVDDQAFCAVNIYAHGDWEEVSIIESIHRNWPDMISQYRVKGVTGGAWSKTQRRAIRKANGNIFQSISDGTVYGAIGGGIAASGLKARSVKAADMRRAEIKYLEVNFGIQLKELIPTFEQCGYAGEDEIEGQLKITESGYQVFFEKYGVLVNLLIEPAKT